MHADHINYFLNLDNILEILMTFTVMPFFNKHQINIVFQIGLICILVSLTCFIIPRALK
jgi:hypothetical protein